MSSRPNLFAWLARPQPILLDGPTGTALEARGFVSHPSLWTAGVIDSAAPLLAEVHDGYLRAGAELITANTFRTTAFAAKKARLAEPEATARRWLFSSVGLARSCIAGAGGSRAVLGSLAPLADCYRPHETPDDDVLRAAHRCTAGWLVEAGCDGVLVETQGCGREARIAVESAIAAAAGAIPVLVSFLPGSNGEQLLDGDDLLTVATDCLRSGAAALLVNCASSDVLLRALERLRPLHDRGVPMGAYPNAARLHVAGGAPRWQADAQAADLAAAGRMLRRAGARILGACCGFSAVDVAGLSAELARPA